MSYITTITLEECTGKEWRIYCNAMPTSGQRMWREKSIWKPQAQENNIKINTKQTGWTNGCWLQLILLGHVSGVFL